MNLIQLITSKKVLPILLVVLSLVAILVCLNYRRNDYMTGALLFVYFFLPALAIELVSMVSYYAFDKLIVKQIAISLLLVIVGLLYSFMIVYIIKYN